MLTCVIFFFCLLFFRARTGRLGDFHTAVRQKVYWNSMKILINPRSKAAHTHSSHAHHRTAEGCRRKTKNDRDRFGWTSRTIRAVRFFRPFVFRGFNIFSGKTEIKKTTTKKLHKTRNENCQKVQKIKNKLLRGAFYFGSAFVVVCVFVVVTNRMSSVQFSQTPFWVVFRFSPYYYYAFFWVDFYGWRYYLAPIG